LSGAALPAAADVTGVTAGADALDDGDAQAASVMRAMVSSVIGRNRGRMFQVYLMQNRVPLNQETRLPL
jgi:hypothetical protein